MRTTVDIPEPLLKNAKRRAAQRGVTVSVVLEDALRQHLAAKPNVAAPPFKLITFRSELVDPDINLDRTSELITRDDEEEYGTAG
jgi:Ribbon-helix-helix protein, copG family